LNKPLVLPGVSKNTLVKENLYEAKVVKV